MPTSPTRWPAGRRAAPRPGPGPLIGRLLAARAAGHEYDPDQVTRFDELARFLAAVPQDLELPAELPALPGERETSLPFFEAYFSNFIEGTEFSVDEAEAVVVSGDIPANRPEDAHDVLGTFEAVADPELRSAVPATAGELFALLERRHRLVMSGRPDQRPGQCKEKPNQAGSYVFVAPPLVEGTLVEGFRRLVELSPGFPRAAFGLFLISEVHPYDDGNGRVARAAMCAELTAVGQSRIVVPIVVRNGEPDCVAQPVPRRTLRPVRANPRLRLALDRRDALAGSAVRRRLPRRYERAHRLDRRRTHRRASGAALVPTPNRGRAGGVGEIRTLEGVATLRPFQDRAIGLTRRRLPCGPAPSGDPGRRAV